MRLLGVFAAILVATVTFAADPLAILLENAGPGTSFLVEVDAEGVVSITPLSGVVRAGQKPTAPPDDPDPTQFEAAISKLTAAALASGGSKTTGAALSSVYSLVSSSVSDGSIPPEKAFEAVKKASDAVLAIQPDAAKWTTFRTELGKALTTLSNDGELTTKAQIAAVLKLIANGMNDATGFSGQTDQRVLARQWVEKGRLFDGIDIAKLIELIKLIMELLKLFGA